MGRDCRMVRTFPGEVECDFLLLPLMGHPAENPFASPSPHSWERCEVGAACGASRSARPSLPLDKSHPIPPDSSRFFREQAPEGSSLQTTASYDAFVRDPHRTRIYGVRLRFYDHRNRTVKPWDRWFTVTVTTGRTTVRAVKIRPYTVYLRTVNHSIFESSGPCRATRKPVPSSACRNLVLDHHLLITSRTHAGASKLRQRAMYCVGTDWQCILLRTSRLGPFHGS
ncbi:hypothetical protein C8R47DRAFT_98781 [Mycena vitilis]|nr:hypothetical protein C8R47DRAFT_98781 [Mycena vitilis]